LNVYGLIGASAGLRRLLGLSQEFMFAASLSYACPLAMLIENKVSPSLEPGPVFGRRNFGSMCTVRRELLPLRRSMPRSLLRNVDTAGNWYSRRSWVPGG